MKKSGLALIAVVLCSSALPVRAAPARWVEGTDYIVLERPQATTVPAGKVEVMDIFSYACPFCDKFEPVIDRVKHSLPPYAQIVFLPASFIPTEDWPMFQQAYFAAQSLGIADRTHQAIYDAVWKTGELATVDQATNELKHPLPSLQDAARYYSKLTGVSEQKFLTAARSFGVAMQMREADAQIKAMQVPGTPCIVVAGKYRVNMDSMHSVDDVVNVVKYLVVKAHSQHPRPAARPSA
ncbi:MAG: thiol:disulfide interchange protein DsbA/DsbL [Steroidobacteraceae bacterium]